MMFAKSMGLLLFFMACIACAPVPREEGATAPNSSSPLHESATLAAQELGPKDIARRDEVEAMMLRGQYLHDGPSELSRIGDIDSVPALLVVLRENPPGKNGIMACTTGHALEALRELTGANPGNTYEAWSAWWSEYKKGNPVSGRLEKTVDANGR